MPSESAKPLPSFETLDGRTYTVSVTYGSIKRVQDETGVMLSDLFASAGSITALFGNDTKFLTVLASLVRPQMPGTEAEWLDTLNGAVVERAADAVLEGVADFFPEPRKGLLMAVLERTQAAAERRRTADDLAARKVLETTDFDALLPIHGSSDSSSPASAA
jgi:hypothetical protein